MKDPSYEIVPYPLIRLEDFGILVQYSRNGEELKLFTTLKAENTCLYSDYHHALTFHITSTFACKQIWDFISGIKWKTITINDIEVSKLPTARIVKVAFIEIEDGEIL